jgi:UDP-glucose 4-epimerase
MILVTGGAGYIGSHCVLALQAAGYEVVVFDNLSSGHRKAIGDTDFIQGDLMNLSDIAQVFESRKIDAVMHFAAKIEVGESMVDPEKYYYNNVYGTMNLLNATKKHNIDKIVFSSTAAIYGEPEYTPIDEAHRKNPINPYGQSKLMIENILDDYDRAYGLRSVRLRYFNVAGADAQGRTGEWHEPETHLIPNILKTNKTFEMYGDDYDTKDGSCIRDYINVEDLAQAHLLGLEYLLNGGKTDCFNLGTNEGNSVKEVFAACEQITGKNIPINIYPRRAGDAAVLIANNSKAKNILNWQPKKTLEDSIRTAYTWELSLSQCLYLL